MQFRVAACVAAGAVGPAAVELMALRAGAPLSDSVVDLAAGWSLLFAAGFATGAGPAGRVLCAATAVLWFAATLEVVDGRVGHAASQVAVLWLAPLVAVLLGTSTPRRLLPADPTSRAIAGLALVRGIVPALAAMAWLTILVGVALVAASVPAPGRRRDGVGDPIAGAKARPETAAAVALGGVVAWQGALVAIGGSASWADYVQAACIALCSAAVMAVRPAAAVGTGDMGRLVVDLGRSRDARSQQDLLGEAIGDRDVRLLYRLGPGLPFVDTTGKATTAPRRGRRLTMLAQGADEQVRGSGRLAALEHSQAALGDPQLERAVLAVGALAVRRLRLAAAAAQQAEKLASVRRRLIDADATERRRFAAEISAGPGRALEQAIAVLMRAVTDTGSDLPGQLRNDLLRAHDQALAARDDLVRTVQGNLDLVLARRGLAAALGDLASGVGAWSDIEPGLADHMVDDLQARTAWFVASEALTNAVRHSGAARIALGARVVDGCLVIEVQDNGVGGADPSGPGWTGLRRRVRDAGGDIFIGPGVTGGTAITASMPVTTSSSTASR